MSIFFYNSTYKSVNPTVFRLTYPGRYTLLSIRNSFATTIFFLFAKFFSLSPLTLNPPCIFSSGFPPLSQPPFAQTFTFLSTSQNRFFYACTYIQNNIADNPDILTSLIE